MKKQGITVFFRAVVIIAAILTLYGFENKEESNTAAGLPEAPRLIAHAGGEIYGIRLTNSLEALENSYNKGFRFMEVDISPTSDGIPVLVHDWGNANWLMNVKYSTMAPAYEEFKSRETILGLSLMDINMLAEWLVEHDDAYIVTDVKYDNLDFLGLFKERYPGVYNRIIPQIYFFDEYEPVKELGFKHIILTLYRSKATDGEIIDFCKSHSLFALTMSSGKASPDRLEKFMEAGTPIYVHTVNDYNAYVKLRDIGVHGIYTDYFQPSAWIE
jgi:glycerophosphoryl diester phosphodiesterase